MSGARARDLVSSFFKKNDDETNWKFIIAFRKKTQNRKIGRRARKKLIKIKEEMFDYLCNYEVVGGKELDDVYEETVEIYENILRNEIKRKMKEEEDIPLALIPPFWLHPEALIILNGANVGTLNELIECEQPVLMELFKYNDDALSDIVLLFKPMGIEFKIARA